MTGVINSAPSKMVPLDAVQPHPRNPNRGNVAVIAESMGETGFYGALIVQRSTGYILAGSHRWQAARQLGLDRVPVIYVDVDEERAAKILLVDNRSTRLGADDEEALAALLQSLPDLEGTGFDDADLDSLLAGLNGHQDAQDGSGDEEIPEPPADPVCKPGEIWALGPHRILCGDARQEVEYRRLLGSARRADHGPPCLAQLCVTSPPYNQSLETFRPSGMMKDDGANERFVHRLADAYADSLPEDAYQDEQVAVLELIRRFMTPDGSIFYNHKVRYREKAVVHPMEWIRRLSFPLRQEIIWDRGTSITLNARMFVPAEERIYWLRCGDDFYFDDQTEIKSFSTVWRFGTSNDVRISAPFARELPLRCIRAASNPGDLVLDPYVGSGTTLIAAHELDRLFVGIELNPAYVDVCCARFEQETGIAPRRLES